MEERKKLTPEHHAILFALLAKETETLAPDAYRAVTKAAVCRYGFERGRRMASRAAALGDDLRPEHYLCYGEWRSSDYREQISHAAKMEPYTLEVTGCCWCEAWKRHGMMKWGNVYCENIDVALTMGFNPQYPLVLQSVLSKGDACCRFIYPNIRMTDEKKDYLAKKRSELGEGALRDFTYHTAHLYYTFEDEAVRRLGEMGRRISERALIEFERKFGTLAAESIQQYKDETF